MPLIVTKGLGSAGSSGFVLDSLTFFTGGVLVLAFTGGITPALTGPSQTASNWTIDGPTSITVQSVAVDGDTIRLETTHPYEDAGEYILNIPVGIMSDDSLKAYLGPYSYLFDGAGDPVTVLQAATIDARTIQLLFDVAPGDTVYDVANYSVDNGLTIVSVSKVTDLVYRLTTSRQEPGVTYTITAPGVTT